jgi:hypothetical protein
LTAERKRGVKSRDKLEVEDGDEKEELEGIHNPSGTLQRCSINNCFFLDLELELTFSEAKRTRSHIRVTCC